MSQKWRRGKYNNPAELESIRSMLQSKKKIAVRILSGSMAPLIKEGDVIEVESFDWKKDSLQKGDVIVFADRGSLICHFVRHINKNSWGSQNEKILVTQGLANFHEDLPLSGEQIIGRVVGIQVNFWHLLKRWLGIKLLPHKRTKGTVK